MGPVLSRPGRAGAGDSRASPAAGARARAERRCSAQPSRPTTPTSSRASSCSCRSAAPATCSRAPAPRAPSGPNLDEAFQQAIKDGMPRSDFAGAIDGQILHPNRQRRRCRPSSSRATRPTTSPPTWRSRSPPAARTPGLLATAVKQAGGGKPAVEKNGTLQIDADPTGQLAYVTDTATGTPGPDHGQDGRTSPARRTTSSSTARARARSSRTAASRSSRPTFTAGDLHVLLLGARPPPGRHAGQAHRQVAPGPQRSGSA